MIASYTLVDGVGVRRSDAPAGYTAWIFLLTGLVLLLGNLHRHRTALYPYGKRYWHVMLVGGGGTLGAYGLALWAMTRAPVASVAALRETSILFAAIIAATLLKERISPRRWASIAMIAVGAALLRLG